MPVIRDEDLEFMWFVVVHYPHMYSVIVTVAVLVVQGRSVVLKDMDGKE